MIDTTNNKTDAMMYGSLPSSANYEREIIVELRKEVERLGHVLRASQSAALENQSEVFRLRSENEKLRAALHPFAEAANGFDMQNVKNPEEWFAYGGIREGGQAPVGAITVGDLRRARAALQDKSDE